jgi:hypothetical protein
MGTEDLLEDVFSGEEEDNEDAGREGVGGEASERVKRTREEDGRWSACSESRVLLSADSRPEEDGFSAVSGWVTVLSDCFPETKREWNSLVSLIEAVGPLLAACISDPRSLFTVFPRISGKSLDCPMDEIWMEPA